MSSTIVPSVVISKDGKRAILISEIEDKWYNRPKFNMFSRIARVIFHPKNLEALPIEIRRSLTSPRGTFNWSIDIEQMEIELIFLAIGNYFAQMKFQILLIAMVVNV